MKRPIPYVLVMMLMVFSIATHSQNVPAAKPKLFATFPDKISCANTELNKVFNSTTDQNISLSFSDNFLFSGTVISNVVKYTNLQTAIIKSPAFGDAIFVLSRISNADRSVSYVGRIINTKYFEGYELKKDAANNYQLIKIETDKVIQVCSQN